MAKALTAQRERPDSDLHSAHKKLGRHISVLRSCLTRLSGTGEPWRQQETYLNKKVVSDQGGRPMTIMAIHMQMHTHTYTSVDTHMHTHTCTHIRTHNSYIV